MSTLRRHSAVTFVVAILAMATWAFSSNHCALVAVASIGADHGGCCQESVPCSPSLQCCDVREVALPGVAIVPPFKAQLVRAAWVEATVLPPPVPPLPLAVPGGHDPPPAITFAELVLGTSLRAHAPPVFVS